MWLSERHRETPRREEAGLGTVTLGGNPAGVYLAGERRNLPVLAPGGFSWAPSTGQQVLVIKTGADGEAPYVAAALSDTAIAPGSVRIFNSLGNASITLDGGGNVRLVGRIYVNGELLSAPPEEEEEDKDEEDGGESSGGDGSSEGGDGSTEEGGSSEGGSSEGGSGEGGA